MLNFVLGLILSIISMVGFGLNNYFMAKSSRKIGPFKTTLWFQAVSLIILILLSTFLFTYTNMQLITLAIILITGVISVVGIFAFTKGLEVGNVSLVSTIASGRGAITAVLGIIILSQTMSYLQLLYIAIIIIGTILASLDIRAILKSQKSTRSTSGVKYAVITLFCWGAYFFLISYITQIIGYFATTLYLTFLTVLFLSIYGGLTKAPASTTKDSFGLLVVIGALNVIALLAYNLGVTFTYTAIVGTISAASPAITIVLALVFLKEKLMLDQKIGIILVLAGIILLAA